MELENNINNLLTQTKEGKKDGLSVMWFLIPSL